MNKPHKHAELIKAWADGAEIQRRSPVRGWEDIYTTPSWDNICEQFRIKPTTIKYRNFLWKTAKGRVIVAITNEQENNTEPRINWEGFIRWLGDWQEVEV